MIAAWLSVAAYMGLIFMVSAMPFDSALFHKAQKIHVDWLVHVVEYSALGFLLVRALKRSRPRSSGTRLFLAALAIGVFYAATDEYHQSFVPTRDSSVHDGLADTAGLALGAWAWMRRHQQKGIPNA